MNVQKLIEKAKLAGIETVEVYIQKSEKESINIYGQKVDSFTIAQSGGISVRGLYHGKLGYCFLEEDNDDNIDLCIEMINQMHQLLKVMIQLKFMREVKNILLLNLHHLYLHQLKIKLIS